MTYAISLSERAGDYHLQASNFVQLGYLQYKAGDFKLAEGTLLQGLKKTREMGDAAQEAQALQKLGWLYIESEQKDKAVDSLKKAHAIFTRIGAQVSAKSVQTYLDALN